MKRFAPLRTTPMYRAHVGLKAVFTERAGWTVPERYTSPEEEARSARGALGVADVSACGKFLARGETVEELCAKLTGAPLPPPGRAARARIDGARALIVRFAPDEMLCLARAGEAAAVAQRLAGAADSAGCAHVTDVTSAFAAIDLVGPAVPSLLARLVPIDLAPLGPLGFAQGEFARVRAVMLRLDAPALPAFHVLVAREYGEFVWDVVLDAGRDLGLTVIGAAAHAALLGAA